MLGRKSLARTSSEPGKTRQINFYNVDNNFYFVDLPGYGFSKMSKQEQVKVGNFIEQYLQIRKEIALIIFLIDIRHEPTANDRLMYDYIINKFKISKRGNGGNCFYNSVRRIVFCSDYAE